MNRQNFPTIAILVSVPLLLALVFGGAGPDGTRLPLLTLLLICEVGAVVNIIALYLGLPLLRERPLPWRKLLRLAVNLLLAVHFTLSLVAFWPG